MTILWLKLAFAIVGATGLAIALRLSRRVPAAMHRRLAGWDVAGLWILARLLPFLVVYVLAAFKPESDVATCFWPQAAAALQGQVPYRDFESFFGPLFPHLLAAGALLWHDPRALIVWMTLLEAATIVLTMNAAGLGEPGPRRTRFLLCAYLAPGPLFLEVIGGQEDFLVWTFGLLTWLAIRRRDWRLAALATVAAMLLTKAIFLLPIALFIAFAPARGKYFAALAMAGAVIAVVLYRLTGLAFLDVLKEGGNISPPQIWLLLHFVSHGLIPAGGAALSFAIVAVLLVTAYVVGRAQAPRLASEFGGFAAAWSWLFVLLIVLSPKSQGAYVGYVLLPLLALSIESDRRIGLWTTIGALAAIVPSVFYRLGEPQPARWSDLSGAWSAANLALQFAFVVALGWIAFAVARVRQPRIA